MTILEKAAQKYKSQKPRDKHIKYDSYVTRHMVKMMHYI